MATIFVASTGGHLAQLRKLAPRIDDSKDCLWVTFDTPQSRSLLTGERHIFVRYIAPRDWIGVLRESRHAFALLRRERPSAVVSTGNAIALSYLPVARLLRIPAVYVESAARALGPSLTGRLVSRVPGIRLFTQYRSQARGSWRFAGSVFDDYGLLAESGEREPQRIFVTLGTIPFAFPHALAAVKRIVPDGCEVSWQLGATRFSGEGGRVVQTMSAADIAIEMAKADVVIAHAGIGSALDSLEAGKTPILLVRRAAHGEHIDDHQEQIAQTLADDGLAIWRWPEDLTEQDLRDAANRRVRVQPATTPLDIQRRPKA